MNKIILLLLIFLFSLNSYALAESSDVKIYVLGEKVSFDNKPQIVNGNTLVPMRPLFEALGAKVSWNEKDQSVTGNRGNLSALVFINQTTAYSGKNPIELEEAPRIIDGYTYVPLRFIAESFGIDVTWDPANNAINVGKPYEAKDIYKIANDAVVYIETSDKDNKPYASGSGFIIDKDGIVVTNYHVIDKASSATVKLADGKTYFVSKVINYDVSLDIAVLKINPSSPLPTVSLGDSNKIENGDKIFTIGNPKNFKNTISEGIVSNKKQFFLNQYQIQISAQITHGSSGGALINTRGEVIGITDGGVGEADLNFAIPINTYKNMKGSKNIILSDIYQAEHILRYSDGTYYEGDIYKGLSDGYGFYKWINGDTYIGDWVKGIRTGKGIYTFANGNKYTGDFLNDAPNGIGTIKLPNGFIYTGDFVNGVSTGYGKGIYTNGDYYEGYWLNNQYSGTGTYHFANGQVRSGTWLNGTFIR